MRQVKCPRSKCYRLNYVATYTISGTAIFDEVYGLVIRKLSLIGCTPSTGLIPLGAVFSASRPGESPQVCIIQDLHRARFLVARIISICTF